MNYQIITDEYRLKEFIEWLPDLKKDEIYMVCLFARKKYCQTVNSVSSDKEQLKRFTSNKQFLYQKIKQLECPLGAYERRGEPIPQESLALYITVNPRSLLKGAVATIHELTKLILQPYNGFNPHQESLSQIVKSKGTRHYIDFDFDNVSISQVFDDIKKSINIDALTILKTRGGFHLLVKVDKVNEKYKKTWYNKIVEIKGCDVRGDSLIPVPGCTQGGFTPFFYKI